jgi:hypothetical protein
VEAAPIVGDPGIHDAPGIREGDRITPGIQGDQVVALRGIRAQIDDPFEINPELAMLGLGLLERQVPAIDLMGLPHLIEMILRGRHAIPEGFEMGNAFRWGALESTVDPR